MRQAKPFSDRRQAASRVHEVFSLIRSTHGTHTELLRQLDAQIWAPMRERTPKGRNRYTASERNYVSGYKDALYDALWRDMEFCYRDANGTLFTTDKGKTNKRQTEEFYARQAGAELGNMEAAHVWRGTDKAFTEWTIPNARKENSNDTLRLYFT